MERKLRTLVVDDEPLARELLCKLLSRQSAVELVGTVGDVASAVEAIGRDAPDLVLLDIQMRGETGFDVLRALEPTKLPAIVFVTAFDQFAVQAFEVAAVDYLLKPVEETRLAAAIERAAQQVRQRQGDAINAKLTALLHEIGTMHRSEERSLQYLDRLAAEMRGQVRVIRVEDIDYISGSGVYVDLHVGERSYPIRMSLQQLEAQLDPAAFMRIHRSHIVRLDRIESMLRERGSDYSVRLKGGAELPLARPKVEELEQWMGIRRP